MKLIYRYILIIVGLIFLVAGISVKWIFFPSILKSQVLKNLQLREGTEGFESFKVPPVDVFMSYMFFHINNTEEVRYGGKPILIEIGPYYYREIQRKEDLFEFNADKLSYSKYIEYHFDAEKTKEMRCKNLHGQDCTIDDEVTVLNPLLITLSELIEKLPDFFADIAYGILDSAITAEDERFVDDLFNTVKVNELLYEGYASPIAEFMTRVIPDLLEGLGVDVKTEEIRHLINLVVPMQVRGGTFAFFKGKNGTKMDNYYTVENGLYDASKLNQIREFNGRSELPMLWWPDVAPRPSGQYSGVGGTCHRILGTDGTQFAPFLSKDVPLWLFVGEMCRAIWMEYEREDEIQGIAVYRYRAGKEVFKMSNPNNYCYCPKFFSCATPAKGEDRWNVTECLRWCKEGTLDVSTCLGAPVIMSQPHFLNADPLLLDDVIGLSPVPEKHDTILDVEPTLGSTLRAHKRIQMSLRLRRKSQLALLNRVAEHTIIPMFWADEGAELDKKNADKLKSTLFTPTLIVDIASIGIGLVVGPIMILAFIYFTCKKTGK